MAEPKKYRKRVVAPADVEAMQIDVSNPESLIAILSWCPLARLNDINADGPVMTLSTSIGHPAYDGDYIAKSTTSGDFVPCKAEVFEADFEQV